MAICREMFRISYPAKEAINIIDREKNYDVALLADTDIADIVRLAEKVLAEANQ